MVALGWEKGAVMEQSSSLEGGVRVISLILIMGSKLDEGSGALPLPH